MAAPERFAESQILLASRAPSIHGPSRKWWSSSRMSGRGAKADKPTSA